MSKLKAPPSNPHMDPSSGPLIVVPQETCLTPIEISSTIDSFKDKFFSERYSYIKKKIEDNTQELAGVSSSLYKLSTERRNLKILGGDGSGDPRSKRQKDAIDMQNGIGSGSGSNFCSSQEDGYASAVLGSSIAVKKTVRPIKLPKLEKLPPYITWTLLRRNQRMTEDQSVVGRRRIYYDKNSGEALICSDTDEEIIEEEGEKEFAESEDYILRMTIEKVGLYDTVLDLLANRFSIKPSEVKARYEDLIKEGATSKNENTEATVNSYLDKDLNAALDSFDNLFCQRCFVFNCQLHGCSQDVILPAEKQPPWSCLDANKEPCGPNCYLAVINPESNSALQTSNHKENSVPLAEEATAEIPESENAKNRSGKDGNVNRSSMRIPGQVFVSGEKRQKKMTASKDLRFHLRKDNGHVNSSPGKEKSHKARRSNRKESSVPDLNNSLPDTAAGSNLIEAVNDQPVTSNYKTAKEGKFVDGHILKKEVSSVEHWRLMEKALFEKGLEIFGRSSCLIARNLLNGLRSCLEVFQYMNLSENKPPSQAVEVDSKDAEVMGNKARIRPRALRRRRRVRRLKYTWKSSRYRSRKKQILVEEELCAHYTPCNCKTHCGEKCPCVVKSIWCEKFCGCPMSCKVRYQGCHCSKHDCSTDYCPCYASGRECDPDVCRFCWVSCGDGSIGIPPDKVSNHKCLNMKSFLRQQQKILLGRSDIAGWGAFLKNSVSKNDYIGEYTGELISHDEADKRGKIYDRENCSYLFNLNDQLVLDAHRKGNKLRFANHSPRPNCFAKVILTATGDHRVCIYALQDINAGDELLYDYKYEANVCPDWAKDLPRPSSKKNDAGPSSSRAKKHT